MFSESACNEEAVETVPIPDTYITGVHRVEFLGRSNVRIHLFAEEDGRRIVVGKLVMAVEDIPAAVAAVMKGTWHRLTHIALTEVAASYRVGRH